MEGGEEAEREEDDLPDYLYGDLADETARIEMEKVKAVLEDCQQENDSLRAEVGQLKQQIMVLVNEKEVLEKNMVSIYHTAIREIKRKDSELTSLRQQLASQKPASLSGNNR